MALFRGEIGKGDDGGPVIEGSCRFFGYVFEGMYVDEREITQGRWKLFRVMVLLTDESFYRHIHA